MKMKNSCRSNNFASNLEGARGSLKLRFQRVECGLSEVSKSRQQSIGMEAGLQELAM